MSTLIADFERDCVQAGHTPSAALVAGGLNPSTWFRWKSGEVSPTLRSFEAARRGLNVLIGHGDGSPVDAGTMATGEDAGAGKSGAVFSPAGAAA